MMMIMMIIKNGGFRTALLGPFLYWKTGALAPLGIGKAQRPFWLGCCQKDNFCSLDPKFGNLMKNGDEIKITKFHNDWIRFAKVSEWVTLPTSLKKLLLALFSFLKNYIKSGLALATLVK